jgi:acyl carrier protein
MIEILMAYEEAFGEEIPDPEIQKIGEFRTRQELIDYLRSRRKGGDLN